MQPREKHTFVVAAALLSITVCALYMLGRILLWIAHPAPLVEKLLALVLLLAEMFMAMHATGYFLNLITTLRRKTSWWIDADSALPLTGEPLVAVIIPSYHEPLDVLSNTLTCLRNLSYPHKQIYLLDDTEYDRHDKDAAELSRYRRQIQTLCEECGVNLFRHVWRGAKAGIINDFLAWNRGSPVAGSEVIIYQDGYTEGCAKYVAIFDSEQNPLPDFLEPLLSVAEVEPTVAFIQTPQYYTNFEYNRVARAAGLMQVFFYEYICEGKGAKNAMFCCGSNVMFKEEALWRVGGLDETSVTEDSATSLKLHLAGWSSLYYPRVCAFGLGPVDLRGFFTQQYRWSRGTLGLLPTLFKEFLKNPRRMSFSKWWEYLLSGTHYLIGVVFLTTAVCPIIFLLLDTPTYFTSAEFYLLFYWPYTVLAALTFIISMRERKYTFKEIATGLLLVPITFPVYIRATAAAILGVRSPFRVTGKGTATSLPLIRLWPQLILNSASFCGMVWGINRMLHGNGPTWALLGNTLWCAYFFFATSFIFYFNRSDERMRS